MLQRLKKAGLGAIAEKVDARERLSFEDGVTLFQSQDLLALGWIANRERERRHGARTFFNHNLRLEATNVCEASCLFCSFARLKEGMPGSHTMSVDQILNKLRARDGEPVTEVHIVNGLHPGLPFSYYTDLLSGLKKVRPGIHLKCFTAVEIAFFADHYGKTDTQVLQELKAAGLDSLPGGGAEIFAPRVRQKICHDKCDGDRYLAIHRIAHGLGMRTNVTMLYGHIETTEERVDHLLQTRALQDDTGGLQAFIPLAFHPDNNQMRKLPPPSASETLKVHQGLLDLVRRGSGADGVVVWRRRSRRHRAGRDHLPHGGIVYADGAVDRRHRTVDLGCRPRADRTRYPLQRGTGANTRRGGTLVPPASSAINHFGG
jgi:aminodeoxyfutalosine synthase